jgi:hypothetical protein
MPLDLLLQNILSPPILFFALGFLAVLLRSDLEIPHPLPKLFSIYLLWAIGFKGGIFLRKSGADPDTFVTLLAAVALSALLPIVSIPLLKRLFSGADACVIGASYGSVSVVTFITAANFLDSQAIPYSGHLVATLALMEAPAIVTGVMMYRHLQRSKDAPASFGSLFREALFGGPVFLLLGSLLAGLLSTEQGWANLRPFTEDIFHGVLVLFLLDSGMLAALRVRDLASGAWKIVGVGASMTIANAALGLLLSRLLGLPPGDALLFTILAASASYIAVPAAMRMAIPEANAGIYIPMALAVTFPINIALGIPLYLWLIETLW